MNAFIFSSILNALGGVGGDGGRIGCESLSLIQFLLRVINRYEILLHMVYFSVSSK